MQPYKNLSGNSGVVAFECRDRSIVVQFQDGWKYEYTHESSGAATVRNMRRLAVTGKGLSTFISRKVKDAYAKKFH